jgi:phosphatidate cytidylyltransferase
LLRIRRTVLKRVITAAVLAPAVVALLLWGPYWLLVVATAIIALLALYEYLGIADASGARSMKITSLIIAAALFGITAWRPDFVMASLLAAFLIMLGIATFRRSTEGILPAVASSFFGLVYVPVALATLPLISLEANGRALLLFLMLVVWTGDIAALYTGKHLGRHKMAPELSPKKTWEGAAGSMVCSLLVAGLLTTFASHFGVSVLGTVPYPGHVWSWLILAALINAAAQLGDLLESALKRGAGIKDSGTLLPGHGGVLDRIDALLLAAPLLWYAQLIPQIFNG